ncbi:MAG: cupin domain-containing protein [Candidatus Limnocylindrales bacterium]|jgi:mannose-6-phosphate isomerase-like protein (cupin superfamily)
MTIRVASLSDMPVLELPGRRLQWLVTPDTLGARNLSVAVMDCPAGSTVRPLHSHRDIEEVLFILEGEGEALVDGEVAPFRRGDAVLFPANSRHMVRNTGNGPLRTCSIFSPPTTSASYILYEGAGW